MSTTLKPKLTATACDGSANADRVSKIDRERKRSKLAIGRVYMAPSDTGSVISSGVGHGTKQVLLEPTYCLDPHKESKFKAQNVNNILQGILDGRLANVTYNAQQCARISQDLATVIKGRIREMGFPRYKIVATVTIGENKGQGVKMASRFLWNTNTDDFATAAFANKDLYAVAAVYGLYLD